MDGAKAGYKDYYYILGVPPTATLQEIKAAYDDLYDRFGPHVSVMGQDPDSMLKAYKDICEAYEVLIDPVRRKQYDSTSTHVEKAHLRSLWGKINAPADVQATVAGDSTRIDVTISLREAVRGCTRKVRVEEHTPCTSCTAMKPVQRMKCEYCRGTGHVNGVRNEEVLLPQKVFDKQELRIPQQGRWDLRANINQDLVVIVNIQPHPVFAINGKEISLTVPVSIYEAVLGGEIQVPTPAGKVVMKIQPLTQNGRVYRLKGMGLGGGDLNMTIQVLVPTHISVEDLELFRKLAAQSAMKNPREELLQKIAQAGETAG